MAIIAQNTTDNPRLLLTDNAGNLYVLLTDGTTTAVIDPALFALTTIDCAHRQVHLGNYFIASNIFLAVAGAGTADLRIIVAATKALHAIVNITVEGKATVHFYEGTTYTGAGVGVTVYNKNRASLTASTATVQHTPAVNVLGTNIYQSFMHGGSRNFAIGSSRGNAQEWIFKKSGDYLIRVTNTSGAASDISIEVEFYEV